METKLGFCTKLKDVLVDVTVEADLSGMMYYIPDESPENKAIRTVKAIGDFEDFLRDHRSQDLVQLSIVKQTMNMCSNCKEVWDTYEEDGHDYCGYCGFEVQVKEAKRD